MAGAIYVLMKSFKHLHHHNNISNASHEFSTVGCWRVGRIEEGLKLTNGRPTTTHAYVNKHDPEVETSGVQILVSIQGLQGVAIHKLNTVVCTRTCAVDYTSILSYYVIITCININNSSYY